MDLARLYFLRNRDQIRCIGHYGLTCMLHAIGGQLDLSMSVSLFPLAVLRNMLAGHSFGQYSASTLGHWTLSVEGLGRWRLISAKDESQGRVSDRVLLRCIGSELRTSISTVWSTYVVSQLCSHQKSPPWLSDTPSAEGSGATLRYHKPELYLGTRRHLQTPY